MGNENAKKHWIGFDLGGTKMYGVLFDHKFNVVASDRKKTKGELGAGSSIERMAEKLQRRCDDYAREQAEAARREKAERERKEREEAERQRALAEKHAGTGRAAQHETRAAVAESRAEEAGAAANAPVADLTRTRTGGATVSGKETWVGKIEDYSKVVASLGPLGAYFKPEEIERAVDKWAKATQGRSTIDGAKAEKEISANIRKR